MQNEKRNIEDTIHEFQAEGQFALFTTPSSKLSGDKSSYLVPTYEALRGICDSIYFKPTFRWCVDECRIMNEAKMVTIAKLAPYINGDRDRAYFTYLVNVKYQIRAHMTWNLTHPELAGDRNPEKHNAIAERSIKKGGRMNPCLGVSECPAYIHTCKFGEGEGFYDNVRELPVGMMYHSIIYPEHFTDRQAAQYKRDKMLVQYDNIVMENGIIHFKRPEDIEPNSQGVANLSYVFAKTYKSGVNITYARRENV